MTFPALEGGGLEVLQLSAVLETVEVFSVVEVLVNEVAVYEDVRVDKMLLDLDALAECRVELPDKALVKEVVVCGDVVAKMLVN
jgi:hypothetical protein